MKANTAVPDILGIPASGTRLLERFKLSEDRDRLRYSFSLENADYLLQPVTGAIRWGYRNDLEVSRLECYRETARRFLGD